MASYHHNLHVKTRNSCSEAVKDEQGISLYQVDPAFYRKIVSRSSSDGHSSRHSLYQSPGSFHFISEMYPGDSQTIAPASTFSHGIHSFIKPTPCIPQSGAKDFMLKKFKQMKAIKNIRFRVPQAIQNRSMSRTKVNAMASFFNSIKKVKNNIQVGKKLKDIKTNSAGSVKNEKAKDRVISTGKIGIHQENGEIDGFDKFPILHADYFEPSPSSSLSSFVPAVRLQKISEHLWTLRKGFLKWSFFKFVKMNH